METQEQKIDLFGGEDGETTVPLEELEVGSHKVTYMYRINDGKHDNRIKLGDATYHTTKTIEQILEETCDDKGLRTSPEIQAAAKRRIDDQTKTADVEYEFIGAWLSIAPKRTRKRRIIKGQYEAFRDYSVHEVLMRSGYKKKFHRADKNQGEWFEIDADTGRAAIRAVIKGKASINGKDIYREVELRPEQTEAIRLANKAFHSGEKKPKKFLWNAIMRFGKTVATYHLVKKMENRISKVLVLTHRPVVVDGWSKDFKHVFIPGSTKWRFASKSKLEKWETLDSDKFFYFVSAQDLRGSFNDIDLDGDGEISEDELKEFFTKNAEIFETEWDMIVLDEAHEGLQTELAQRMFSELKGKYTLRLSGTPYNIISEFEEDELFTWSYVDEQRAKEQYALDHPNEPSPYDALPELRIHTFDVSEIMTKFPQVPFDQSYFNLNRLFEVDKTQVRYGKFYGKNKDGYHPFIYEKQIHLLLSLMTDTKQGSGLEIDPMTGETFEKISTNMPYAGDRAWVDFADTLWVLPSIDASKALHELLNVHGGFSGVKVVNATGDNDSGDPLDDVLTAIEEHDRTITLSVGKLTTGTTVPAWTAVFMFSNMKSPTGYLQTIFRAKSPGSLRDGRMKQVASVFDFAPVRTLNVMNEVAGHIADENKRRNKVVPALPVNPDGTDDDDLLIGPLATVGNDPMDSPDPSVVLDEMLRFLPIVAYSGGRFRVADSDYIMKTINRVYIEENVKKGFASNRLYNISSVDTVDDSELALFDSFLGKPAKKTKEGATVADEAVNPKGPPKPRNAPVTPSEPVEVDESEQERRQRLDRRDKALTAMRAVSVRIPLMVLGVPLKDSNGKTVKITLENFPDLVDDASWVEFMPQGFAKYGLTQPSWEFMKRFYDKTVFEGSIQALQEQVDYICKLPVMDRIPRIAQLLGTMKNPDKETVLTPWSVVNLQHRLTIGGLVWTNDEGQFRVWDTVDNVHRFVDVEEALESLTLRFDPEWVDGDNEVWDSPEASVFDFNSKTALYPLFGAVSLFHRRKQNGYTGDDNSLWKEVLENHVFVNARVPYSQKIAERVLRGYDETIEVNSTCVDLYVVKEHMDWLKFNRVYKCRPQKKNESVEEYAEFEAEWKSKQTFLHKEQLLDWILNPSSMKRYKTNDGRITTKADERYKYLMEIEDGDVLLQRLRSDLSTEEDDVKFGAIVSNPPYQLLVGEGDKKASVQIFPWFQEVATWLSPATAMVYPAHWQKDITKDLGQHLMENGLVLSDYYAGEKLFGESIRDNFPISVVYRKMGYHGPVSVNGVERKRRYDVWIDSDALELLWTKTQRPNQGYLSGVTFPTDLSNIETATGFTFSDSPDSIEDPIAVYIKKSPGKQADGGTYYTDRATFVDYYPDAELNTYRVCVQSAVLGRLSIIREFLLNGGNLAARVYEPNKTHSATWAEVRGFETETEAENFKDYLNSMFVGDLIMLDFSRATFGSTIPDLGDYTNGNPLFQADAELEPTHEYYGLTLDQRLLKSFGFSESEAAVVESHVRH